MIKNYSLPDEIGRAIGRALRGNLSVDVHIDLIGNSAEAMRIIEALSRDEQRPTEDIAGGTRIWVKRFGIPYGICARGPATSTTASPS